MAGLTDARTGSEAFHLAREFAARRAKDKRYSNAAFARDLGISASMLCRVLKGTKRLSTESALCIAARMPWPERRRRAFVESVRMRKASTGGMESGSEVDETETLLSADAFALIARWQHPAILELLRLQSVDGRSTEVATLLEITPAQAREALDRLARLGLAKVEDGRWHRTGNGHIRVPDVPSSAIRGFHKSMLDKAWDALERVSPERRDCTGLVVATTPERVSTAKRLIERFRSELRAHLEDCEPTIISHLAIQLFPLSKEVLPPTRTGSIFQSRCDIG